ARPPPSRASGTMCAIEIPSCWNETRPSVASTHIPFRGCDEAFNASCSSGMPDACGPAPATTIIARSNLFESKYVQSFALFHCDKSGAEPFPEFECQLNIHV